MLVEGYVNVLAYLVSSEPPLRDILCYKTFIAEFDPFTQLPYRLDLLTSEAWEMHNNESIPRDVTPKLLSVLNATPRYTVAGSSSIGGVVVTAWCGDH